MGRYITDVNILTPYGGEPVHVPTGWHKLDTDLNSGAGGDYVYLVYERADQDQKNPIRDIRILVGDEKPPAKYQKIPVDLNKGAFYEEKNVTDVRKKKRNPLFMAVTRDPDAGDPIEDLVLTSWLDGNHEVAPPSGYSRIKGDLNDGVRKQKHDGTFTTTHIYLDRKPAVLS